jgi:hypothetical protein
MEKTLRVPASNGHDRIGFSITGHPRAKLRAGVLLALLAFWNCTLRADESRVAPSPDFRFLQNEQVRIGIRLSSGAAVAWFSQVEGPNLINIYDRGRLLQQSYYGDVDGSVWAKTPWCWNAVQGGSFRGESAKVLELKQSDDELFARTLPKHWATGRDLPEVTLEERIRLSGPVATLRFRMSYDGAHSHAARDQEIPALFVERRLSMLVTYDGQSPWTNGKLRELHPGFPNEYYDCSEGWAAWIDESTGTGIGISVPRTTRLTCYRVGEIGEAGSCSYLAPLINLALAPGVKFEYDASLTIGSIEQIRSRFRQIHEAVNAPN